MTSISLNEKIKRPNDLLRRAREARGWTQADLAALLNVSSITIGRWERGDVSPTRYAQIELAQIFERSPGDLGFAPATVVTEPSPEKLFLIDPMIPERRAALIGRDKLVEDLSAQLLHAPIIALYGLPGIGKTALACLLTSLLIEQHQSFDGILWAGLGPKANVPEILSHWGSLLGIRASGIGASKSDAWSLILREVIGMRRLLIVLDDAWSITDLLSLKVGGPNCAYIATTRFPQIALTFSTNGAIKIPELSEEEGMLLLEYLAPEIRTFSPDHILPLVRSVGALPLALTLAGRYLRAQGYRGQSRRIQAAIEHLLDPIQRFHVSEPVGSANAHASLSSGTPVSLQSVIALSDDHLNEFARQTLRALSVFPAKPNTFSEESALAVAQASVKGLDILIDAGLLEVKGAGRYMLHQTIADYARTLLSDLAPLQRFVAYFTTYVETHRGDIELLEVESQNINAALEASHVLGKREDLVRSVCAFTPFLLLRGLYERAKFHLQRVYSVLQIMEDFPATLLCLHYLGMVAQKQGEYQLATEYYQEGLAVARKTESKRKICEFLSDLGWVLAKRGDYDQAYIFVQEGLKLVEQIGDEIHQSRLLTVLGVIADNRGQYNQAKEYYQKGLMLAQQNEDKEQQCVILNDLGVNAAEQGRSREAIGMIQEVLQLARQMKHLEWQCLAVLNLCAYHEEVGEYELARQYNDEALHLAKQLDHQEWLCFSFLAQGALAIRGKNYPQAEISLQEGLALARQIEKPLYLCEILKYLGDLALGKQQVDAAKFFYTEIMRVAPNGHKGLYAETLYRLGLVEAACQDQQQAMEYGSAALAILKEIQYKSLREVQEWVEMGCLPALPSSLS